MDEREGFAVIDFDRVVTHTDSATLIEIDTVKFWIPHKLIEESDPEARQFMVPEWFALKEGLI